MTSSEVRQVRLPCNCITAVDTIHFTKGDRGVACSRHERAFVISAVLPTDPEYRVTKEIAYQPQENKS